MANVLSINSMPDDLVQILRAMLPSELVLTTTDRDASSQIRKHLPSSDIILVADAPVSREMIESARNLRLIQHMGVGYDNVDLDAARERGIPVCCTPSGTIIGVAEHTFLLILAVYRKLVNADRALREGRFLRWELRTQSFELNGKTLGIIGLGRIGCEVALRANAFGCRVVYYDPYARLNLVEQNKRNVQPLSFDRLLGQSDIVSLHTPLTKETREIIGEAELQHMKPSAILINTARGKLIDEEALVRALREKWIAGAGLDVFREEPPPADHPLWKFDNVVVTPHIATGTIDSFKAKMESCIANMMRLVHGEPLREQVNLK